MKTLFFATLTLTSLFIEVFDIILALSEGLIDTFTATSRIVYLDFEAGLTGKRSRTLAFATVVIVKPSWIAVTVCLVLCHLVYRTSRCVLVTIFTINGEVVDSTNQTDLKCEKMPPVVP